jgi:F-type H+-transporting ATPase subunit b
MLAKQELERLQKESADMLRQARIEAEAVIARSRTDAEALREELKQKSRAEAAAIVKNAEQQIRLETARAVQQIRHEAVDLSVEIASKILQRQVSREDNAALIEATLKQVEARHS